MPQALQDVVKTIGDHTRLDMSGVHTLEKPSGATHLKAQVITQNLRYTVDGTAATTVVGFQLTAGADTLIPCPNASISLCEEVAGAILQYQWVC